MPAPTDWAYLAGLIDGEGTLVVSHRTRCAADGTVYPKRYLHLQLLVYNTSAMLLDHVQRLFGGHVYWVQRKEEHYRKSGSWRPNVSDIPFVLNGVMPYLIIKKRQAEIVLDLHSSMTSASAGRKAGTPPHIYELRNRLTDELRYLNRRGTYASSQ